MEDNNGIRLVALHEDDYKRLEGVLNPLSQEWYSTIEAAKHAWFGGVVLQTLPKLVNLTSEEVQYVEETIEEVADDVVTEITNHPDFNSILASVILEHLVHNGYDPNYNMVDGEVLEGISCEAEEGDSDDEQHGVPFDAQGYTATMVALNATLKK